MANNVKWKVEKHLGTLYTTIRGRRAEEGWSKQVNIVSWNGGVAKIDIRDWNEDMTRMSKGITLSPEEAKEVMTILKGWFEEGEE